MGRTAAESFVIPMFGPFQLIIKSERQRRCAAERDSGIFENTALWLAHSRTQTSVSYFSTRINGRLEKETRQ